jgi:hypothetical protein
LRVLPCKGPLHVTFRTFTPKLMSLVRVPYEPQRTAAVLTIVSTFVPSGARAGLTEQRCAARDRCRPACRALARVQLRSGMSRLEATIDQVLDTDEGVSARIAVACRVAGRGGVKRCRRSQGGTTPARKSPRLRARASKTASFAP